MKDEKEIREMADRIIHLRIAKIMNGMKTDLTEDIQIETLKWVLKDEKLVGDKGSDRTDR